MRILLHDYGGYGFIAQLSRELASRGHDILHLYAGYNNTPKGRLTAGGGSAGDLSFRPLYTREPLAKYSFLERWRQEREYGELLAKEVEAYGPQVVVSAQTPLDAQGRFQQASQQVDADFVFWVQDLIGVATRHILRRKIPLLGELIGLYYVRMERKLIERSDRVIVISEAFNHVLESWGIRGEKVHLVPNWAPVGELPVERKDNPWARESGLADKFVFLYTGTLALKHNPRLLLDLALEYTDRAEVRIAVVSEGPGANWLKAQVDRRSLENLLVMDYQPVDRVPQVLASGDVLLAVLTQDAGRFSVPSKVLTYCCAARPILASIPLENPAARLITREDAGLVSAPDDVLGFKTNAERLRTDAELRAQMGRSGRSFAEREFDLGRIADRFEGLLS